MKNAPNSTLAQLAEYADICRKFVDPDQRAKCVSEWFGKLPANQQRLLNDLAPLANNIGARFLKPGGSSNARS